VDSSQASEEASGGKCKFYSQGPQALVPACFVGKPSDCWPHVKFMNFLFSVQRCVKTKKTTIFEANWLGKKRANFHFGD
jgi:hypothetical protein